jgi:hypothetical protein
MPTVAGFKTTACALDLWRAVEAQHRISTMVLVDTLAEQALLEAALEQSKPPLLATQAQLHWLLFTPFRYPPLPTGSRFRGPGDPGVFYGAESQQAACAEVGYWRWRLLQDSPDLDAIDPMPQTLFCTPVNAMAIDLRQAPLAARRKQWMHASDYAPCQQLARQVREAGIALIRYASVRDPDAGGCAAVLDPVAFAADQPAVSETWMLAVSRERVFWRKESIFEERVFEFGMGRWVVTPSFPAS